MTRQRLPNRRPSFTTQLVYESSVYSATLGFDVTNERIAEVFTHGAKVGSGMDRILDDACVALSLLLQHGIEPAALAASMGRLGDGTSPGLDHWSACRSDRSGGSSMNAPFTPQCALGRLVPNAATSEAELFAMRRRAWREQGIVILSVRGIEDPWLRQAILNEAERLYGDTMVRAR